MLIDTHAHLNFPVFDKDREEAIKRCLDNNVHLINIGTNFETSKKAVEIAEKYEKGVFAAVGLHPINLDTGLVKIRVDESEGKHFEREFDYEKYKELAKSLKVVAIGEIGLDYYWKPKTKRKLELFKERQKELFLKELELAKELNLPVIFHCRMAHEDLIKILTDPDRNSYDRRNHGQIKGVIHCFTGDWEQAEKYLKVGFYLGFNGLIFKMNFDEIIKKTPIEKILIETDCPYLTPPIGVNQRTHRRQSASTIRNEPINVKYIAEEIARIKNLSFEKVSEITRTNAKELFQI